VRLQEQEGEDFDCDWNRRLGNEMLVVGRVLSHLYRLDRVLFHVGGGKCNFVGLVGGGVVGETFPHVVDILDEKVHSFGVGRRNHREMVQAMNHV
jgi:hypothetical protein